MAFDIMLGGYIQPNNLMDDEMFWRFDAARVLLGVLGITNMFASWQIVNKKL